MPRLKAHRASCIGILVAFAASLPVRSVKEFIALARARPGQIDYASSGLGGSGHLAGELFKSVTRIVRDPSVLERLSGDGVVGTGSTPQEAGAYIKSESVKWGKVVRDAGIKLD